MDDQVIKGLIAIVAGLLAISILKVLLAFNRKFNRMVRNVTLGLACILTVPAFVSGGEAKLYILISLAVLHGISFYCIAILGVEIFKNDWENWDGSVEVSFDSSYRTAKETPLVKRKGAGMFFGSLILCALVDVGVGGFLFMPAILIPSAVLFYTCFQERKSKQQFKQNK